MPQAVMHKNVGKSMINAITGWNISDISFFQGTTVIPLSEDKSDRYSEFNAAIQIERREPGFVLKHFSLIIVVAVFLHFVYLMPPDRPGLGMLIGAAPVAMAEIHRLKLLAPLHPGHVPIEHVFFLVYASAAVAGLIFSWMCVTHGRGNPRRAARLARAGRLAHVTLLSAGALLIAHLHGIV